MEYLENNDLILFLEHFKCHASGSKEQARPKLWRILFSLLYCYIRAATLCFHPSNLSGPTLNPQQALFSKRDF